MSASEPRRGWSGALLPLALSLAVHAACAVALMQRPGRPFPGSGAGGGEAVRAVRLEWIAESAAPAEQPAVQTPSATLPPAPLTARAEPPPDEPASSVPEAGPSGAAAVAAAAPPATAQARALAPPRAPPPAPPPAPGAAATAPSTASPAVPATPEAEPQAAPVAAAAAAVPAPAPPSSRPLAPAFLAPEALGENPRPAYPGAARRRGHEGTVVLRVRVAADGTAQSVAVLESSGHPTLDAAARDGVRRWRFRPARRGGAAIAHDLDVPIVFRLRDEPR